ncbi:MULTISPECIES: bis(5'-nucleosyl)-tetraphosphatase (symmetrical) YqeK [Fusobacterium]|uniref:bis(5'-nucleosyl)-tetraphosphatase (symmetrical) n=1 Tax=Fusobacterium ulcerans TaxID=861 RepID=A0AAX1TR85_9FUSO|nr:MULTISPECIES: bis(5'-nucleosyl)-tetraphosphatase (symmetrical) YqeK [Fusobacterium]AVQ27898.1 HD domain-containing protein [Fusobacterium ulcerans]EFS27490.1 putative HD superfamily hydrolase [Fusobacterium ulcerans ATCC 49185]MCB8565384.1 bis(5'-nucleosyl)-tetraphosphatase (symmetrical) YqeK [Fusobacterium ulcerans]MCB8649316.1 bis(5'-nucleosyl)-tetraphosphatase (symmetrical) YqeK [Fusobacterium ulcerans]MDH6458532.1 putative HD superfamily hydrolase involved in NAD metabolism [Fusobacteri
MLEELRDRVRKRMREKRYIHTLGVEEKAVELAEKYGADIEKCRIAAILHDVAKEMQIDKMKDICQKNFSEELSKEDMEINEILHGFAGCIIARDEFGITDEDILNGIKYHTVGKRGLSLLGRIIYIADGIEKNRDYPAVDEIRREVEKDLDKGIILEIDRKVEYLTERKGKIHKNTVEMREWLKKKQPKEEK